MKNDLLGFKHYIILDDLFFSSLVVNSYIFLFVYGHQWTQVLVFYVLYGSDIFLLGIVIFLLILTMNSE